MLFYAVNEVSGDSSHVERRKGILYVCPYGFNANNLSRIRANLSSQGTKLHLKFPWDHFGSVGSFSTMFYGMEDTSDPSDFIGGFVDLFKKGTGKVPNEINLPSEEAANRSIKSPTLIYSRDGSGPAIIHFDFNEEEVRRNSRFLNA